MNITSCSGRSSAEVALTVEKGRRTSQLLGRVDSGGILPGPKKLPRISDIVDAEIMANPSDAAKGVYREVLELVGREKIRGVSVLTRSSKHLLINNHGYSSSYRETDLTVAVKGHSGPPSTSVTAVFETRRVKDLDCDNIREEVETMTRVAKLPRKLPDRNCPCILLGNSVGNFFANVFGNCVNIRTIKSTGSLLSHALKTKIGPESLTITDDGTASSGTKSAPFDGDGNPKRRITLLERGVLQAFLYDSWYAKKDLVEPTGSVERENYDSYPSISTSNIQIDLGRNDSESMISRHAMCLIIKEARFSVEPRTGNAYGLVDFGYYVEKGKPRALISGGYVGLNLIDALNKIDDISSDDISKPGWLTPSLLFEKGAIAMMN